MYKVFKDHGEEIAEYKTLAAAKKLAEKQHGEVFCDGKKVYPTEQDGSADVSTSDTSAQEATADAQGEHYEVQDEDAPDSTDAIEQEAPDNTSAISLEKEDNTGRYRIESLMNVRLHPALNADIVGIAQPGTVVTVTGINNDWMAVKNGNETVYIMYGGGRYATRM